MIRFFAFIIDDDNSLSLFTSAFSVYIELTRRIVQWIAISLFSLREIEMTNVVYDKLGQFYLVKKNVQHQAF